MFNKLMLLFFCMALGLFGCEERSGAQKTLSEMAAALESNNSGAFLSKIDMKTYAANYIKNKTQSDETLSSLNALGNMLGLGNIDELLGSVMDIQGRMAQELDRGVASGELVIQCRRAETPDCPWVPKAMKDAEVIQLGENAAIAKITTPAKLTSWLAFSKIDGQWMVVGQAVLESQARAYANAGAEPKITPEGAQVNI